MDLFISRRASAQFFGFLPKVREDPECYHKGSRSLAPDSDKW